MFADTRAKLSGASLFRGGLSANANGEDHKQADALPALLANLPEFGCSLLERDGWSGLIRQGSGKVYKVGQIQLTVGRDEISDSWLSRQGCKLQRLYSGEEYRPSLLSLQVPS